jgi:hypothetical protein
MSMTKRQAQRLARRITRDDPRCQVTDYHRTPTVRGPRIWFWVLAVTDTRTGYGFIVRDPEHWAEILEQTSAHLYV